MLLVLLRRLLVRVKVTAACISNFVPDGLLLVAVRLPGCFVKAKVEVVGYVGTRFAPGLVFKGSL